jgi:alginate O-acetyltransferase complex protein AlgI
LNAIYFLPLLVTSTNRNNLEIVAQGKSLPTIREFFSMLFTFLLATLAWIFFRANDVSHALHIISKIFSSSLFMISDFRDKADALRTVIILFFFVLVEWKGREQQYAIAKFGLGWRPVMRYALYYSILIMIIWFGGKEHQFIYFQF